MTGKCGIRQVVKDSLEQSLEDYADIWAELAAWDALSDEAWELIEFTAVATPLQPTIQVRTVTIVIR